MQTHSLQALPNNTSQDHNIRSKFNLPGLEFNIPEEDFHIFITTDNLKLHTYRYTCKSPRALIINFHGLHSYTNNHAIVGKYMSDINIDFVGYDQRGHGKSEGIPALLPSLSQLVGDACKFVQEMAGLYNELPIFLTGGSLGGALCFAVSLELQHLVRGVIVTNPAIAGESRRERFLISALNCLGRCIPGMRLGRSISRKTSKEELYKYLEENPFSYSGRVKLGSLNTLAKLMKQTRDRAPEVSCPFVIIVGLRDTVINPKNSKVFFDKASSVDKEFWEYEKIKHAMIFNKNIYAICERMCEWINEKLKFI